MFSKTIVFAFVAAFSCVGSGFAHAACSPHDVKLKYTEIGQLIQAEMAGSSSDAEAMTTKMHSIQGKLTSGDINTDQFCREYDSLIEEMKANR
jgi:hypothetical protein